MEKRKQDENRRSTVEELKALVSHSNETIGRQYQVIRPISDLAERGKDLRTNWLDC